MLARSSLRGSEWSPSLEVIADISSLGSGLQTEVVSLPFFGFCLNVNVLHVVNAKRLSLCVVQQLGSLFFQLIDSVLSFGESLLMAFRMVDSQESVVIIVYVQLERVLVVGKQRVVSVGYVGESTALDSVKVS